MNCGVAVKGNTLFLFGGMFEDGDKQLTLGDFYSLDLKKLEEWRVLVEDDLKCIEWISEESDSESSSEDDEEEEEGGEC